MAMSEIQRFEGGSNVAYLLRILRRLSRLFRAKRLTTRATVVDPQLHRCLAEVNRSVHNSHLARGGQLEDIYEKSRLVDLLHDMSGLVLMTRSTIHLTSWAE
ncbi:hypothetical protein PENSPDRAFT_647681 [Peniophora sp. CONT]|nr:hypothetical protein PENSPDRAFT_647681 [Peniophora sp. CONT]